jgi:hypothetical protein
MTKCVGSHESIFSSGMLVSLRAFLTHRVSMIFFIASVDFQWVITMIGLIVIGGLNFVSLKNGNE